MRESNTTSRGSLGWAMRLAETSAWASCLLILVVLAVSPLDAAGRVRGVVLVVALGAWIVASFRYVIPRFGGDGRWSGGLAATGLVFASLGYWLLGHHEPSSYLLYAPVVLCAGLLGGFAVGAGTALGATIAYCATSTAAGTWRGVDEALFAAALFALTGVISGALTRELATHVRGEQEEHRISTAVRHRLGAVLDAVDEAIVLADAQGMVRLINRRAADLFGLDPDQFRDGPVVQLQRTLARQTEDPEGFMETFQAVRDDPLLEIRTLVEQIIPTRRQMRLYSAPALDDRGQPVGRIEVFTDITDAMARSAEVRRLLDQARQVAESYQRSLLPTSTPALPRMSLVAHYVAAAGRRAVCGDFYDFVPLQNNRVGVVLGDVVGAGPAAANDAALTRYTLRSFAGELSSPERLLQWMNRHLNEQLEAERFVRLLLVSLDPERARLDYVNAGHVPPVLYRFATGQVEWLAEGGLVLGVEEDSVYKPASVDLEPGDMLVLYTDGVTEAPRNGRPFGQAHLTDIVAKYGVGTPGEMIQAIRRAVNAWVEDGELRDDLSVIVCQVVPDELIGEPVRELVLPNDPARLAEMRGFVASYLAAVRAPVEPSSELLLAVGEATANATRHGRIDDRSEVRIRCSLNGPDAVVAVADDGTGFQPSEEDLAAPQDRFASGGRGMYLMKALTDHIDVTGSRTGTTVTLHKRMWEQ